MKDYAAVDKRLVHKYVEENVLLANLRRILPTAVDAAAFEAIVESVPPNEQQLLLSAYEKLVPAPQWGMEAAYITREVQGAMKLPEQIFQEIHEKLNKDEQTVLQACYAGGQNGSRTLTRPPSDDLVRHIVRLASLQEHYLHNKLKCDVSDILERHQLPEKQDVFFANMIVDTKHSFFFEHPNEHVPGMMLIEAVRQFIMAVGHKFGNVPIGGTHIVLDMLEAGFVGYVELYAPILLRGDVVLKNERHGVWNSLTMEVTIHQNGNRLGTVTCSGSNISPAVFERIRRIKIDELRSFPFVPIDNLSYSLFLKSTDQASWFEARIEHMSLDSFALAIEATNGESLTGDFDFIMVVAEFGSIKGRCHLLESTNNHFLFAIDALDKGEGEKLAFVLKRYCKVPERVTMC